MKKILIPTDFSAVADNAKKYAIEVADAFKSKLFLYHVYAIKKADYDHNISDKQQPFRKKMKLNMKNNLEKFKKVIAKKGLDIKTKVYQGNVSSLFGKTVKKDGTDLIVMGSKGASNINKVIFGSIAAQALKMSKIPLLVVPPKYDFQPIQHIVLAVDNKKVSLPVLSPLQKLAVKFGAKITILYVDTGLKKDIKRAKNLDLGKIKTKYQEVPMSKNINESISKFIKKEGCDLLCMVQRKKGFFESIFKKNITKNQVYINRVPLLILPE